MTTTSRSTTKRPVTQVDYAFLVDKEETKKEGTDESTTTRMSTTALTACDVTTGTVMAAVVKNKGVNDYVVNELRRFILECGRSNAVLQSDQESSIRALCQEVAAKVGMSTRLSPAYSSRSLGSAERWHESLWAQCKLFKELLKDNYNMKISVQSPLMCLIVKHSAWLHNRYQLHQDGKNVGK